ncbi:DUF6328 family protein [Arthrobacter sp. 2MCAF14]|uniref:DUF6328 family protein n=1 Tax=Arthrobacter sp. 2MCAF14 TaxID=3232982 RepID=UPI003F90EC2C
MSGPEDPLLPGPDPDTRHESEDQRMDRNWNELLQEMRVLQTGVQIIGGFLLTLPFQQRFGTLTEMQKWWFLLLVVLATMTTGLMLVPVSLHRRLFQHHVKYRLVAAGDVIVKAVVACVSLLIAGCAGLIFSVAVGPEAGLAAGGSILVALAALVLLYPLLSWSPGRRKARSEHPSGKAPESQKP